MQLLHFYASVLHFYAVITFLCNHNISMPNKSTRVFDHTVYESCPNLGSQEYRHVVGSTYTLQMSNAVRSTCLMCWTLQRRCIVQLSITHALSSVTILDLTLFVREFLTGRGTLRLNADRAIVKRGALLPPSPIGNSG